MWFSLVAMSKEMSLCHFLKIAVMTTNLEIWGISSEKSSAGIEPPGRPLNFRLHWLWPHLTIWDKQQFRFDWPHPICYLLEWHRRMWVFTTRGSIRPWVKIHSCSRSLLLSVVLLWLGKESEETSRMQGSCLRFVKLRVGGAPLLHGRIWVDEAGSGGQRQDFREMKFWGEILLIDKAAYANLCSVWGRKRAKSVHGKFGNSTMRKEGDGVFVWWCFWRAKPFLSRGLVNCSLQMWGESVYKRNDPRHKQRCKRSSKVTAWAQKCCLIWVQKL